MDVLQNILLALHILGLALIIGTFAVQLRAKTGFRTDLVLTGAIVQVVTGIALVGVGEAALDRDYNMIKIGVKLTIAVIVLVAAIIAAIVAKRGGRVQPWFHTAGGLAVVNVLVAVLWR